MKTPFIVLGIAVVVSIGALLWLFTPVAHTVVPQFNIDGGAQEPVACTMDAKICPDGTAVGRTFPDCEFAACPISEEEPSNDGRTDMATDAVAIGGTIHLSGIDITPLRVIEDSRCPVDVTCVWEGRLQVEVKLKSYVDERTVLIDPQNPVATESGRVTLVSATPVPIAGVEIPSFEYRFAFRVTKS